jgi:hypothetical protein
MSMFQVNLAGVRMAFGRLLKDSDKTVEIESDEIF